jgi:MOSC domain-containing protein YiiM
MASLHQILIASSPSSPMTTCVEIRAVPGRGLEGDRYFSGTGTFSPQPQKPDFEVTLIEQEKIDAFARDSGLPFTAEMVRRNLVTSGVDLNALVGREFRVGSVRLRGLRLCEPCSYLAKISFPATLRGLVHQGGLRAQIVSEGVIRIGDAVSAA